MLVLLVRGRSNKQIATQLSITPRTVGSHVEHIYAKIGVSTRGAAAMFAMRHGLVDATAVDDEAGPKIGSLTDAGAFDAAVERAHGHHVTPVGHRPRHR